MTSLTHLSPLARFILVKMAAPGCTTTSDAVRHAAAFSRYDFAATSSQFADASVELGMKRNSSMNRFNEALRADEEVEADYAAFVAQLETDPKARADYEAFVATLQLPEDVAA